MIAEKKSHVECMQCGVSLCKECSVSIHKSLLGHTISSITKTGDSASTSTEVDSNASTGNGILLKKLIKFRY